MNGIANLLKVRNLPSLLIAVLTGPVVAGCSSASLGTAPASKRLSATASVSPAATAPNSEMQIRSVADKYYAEIIAGNFGAAAQYVLPSQRDFIRALGMSAAKGATTEGTVEVASVHRRGSTASVVLTGKMCQHQSGAAPRCVINEDPRSQDPVFTLELTHQSARWWVSFRLSPQSSSPS